MIKKKIEIIETKNYSDQLEIIAIKIYNLKDISDFKLINLYIHPNCRAELLDKLRKLLGEMKCNIIISGDLNDHHMKWSKGKQNKIALTQKSELRALTGPSPDQKGDTPSSEYGAIAL